VCFATHCSTLLTILATFLPSSSAGSKGSDLTIGRNVADQPHGLRLSGTLEVADIATVGTAQRNHLFQEPAAHQRDQGWQGQLALAGEGVGMFGVGGVQEKFGRAYARGKIDKKREKGHVGQ
jgi:hypothetical protein